MRQIRVGLIQHLCSQDLTENLDCSSNGVRKAAADGAQLVVLQELHGSRYFCQQEDTVHFDLAEPIPGPTSSRMMELAAELCVVLVLSLFERRATGLYHNTALVIERDGTIAGRYRKMHIPDDPGYYEKFYFTPGDNDFRPVDTSLGKLGVLVCWDQWFPEAARLMALAGADLLLYPTAIGWDPADSKEEQQRQHQAWQLVQRGHAIANGLPLVAVNRVGHEPDPAGGAGIDFWGSSFVTGSQGELLGEASETQEEVLVIDIDLERCEQVRRIWPFLRDRRIDSYQGLLQRFRD